MRSMEDKEVTSNGTTINFEFHKGSGSNRAASSHHQHHPHRTPLGKPAPSKWDDAQKWLVGLSRGGHEKGVSKNKPRNSNADDTRLIAPTPQQETDFSSTGEEEVEKAENVGSASSNSRVSYEVETKKVDCEESFWCVNKSIMATENGSSGVRSVYLRDMGTEMTPAASQEPSRTATPVRAATPVGPRSPITSGSTTPIRCQHAGQSVDDHEAGVLTIDPKASPLARGNAATTHPGVVGGVTVCNGSGQGIPDHVTENRNVEHAKKMNPLEMRAMAWDEAERAKYMARYKQEEVKIQAWENHQKRKAEMQMKKMEVKAERMKARAQEKCANKLASTRRIAEEKRGNAEAKLNEKAVRTSEKADYIRRTGRLPSSFSFKFPSCCCCW